MAFPATNDYMQSEGNSRKRVRISRDNEPRNAMQCASSSATMHAPSSSAMPIAASTHVNGTSCHFEQSFNNIQDDLEAMRGLITCQICHRFMYEPYSLQCGHTYCYSCVSSWFRGKTRKNCPECRSVIVQTPTPSYIIKEMVHIFSGRTQLLPDGETSEEHMRFASEEADIVARDKADPDPETGGLFKGIFRPGQMLQAIRDVSDNVYRCPNCLHEVEDGWCNHCGEPVEDERGEGFSEYDTDDDLDGDLEDMDGHSDLSGVDGQRDAIELFGNGQIRIRHARQRGTHSPIEVSSHTSDDDESGSELDEDETEFNSFVVPDDTNIYDDSASDDGLPHSEDFEPGSEPAQPAASRRNRRARQTVVLSSDDEDAGPAQTSRSRANRQVINVDDDEEDELPATTANQRGRTGSRQQDSIEVSSSSDDGSDDGSEDDSGEDDESSGSDDSDTDGPQGVAFSNQGPRFDFTRRPRTNQMYQTNEFDQHSGEDDEMHTDDLGEGVDYGDEEDDDEEASEGNSTDSGSTRENIPQRDIQQYRQPPLNNSRHRLQTRTQRRNRHADPETTSLSNAPVHPFQLSNTLAQIHERHAPLQAPAYTRAPPTLRSRHSLPNIRQQLETTQQLFEAQNSTIRELARQLDGIHQLIDGQRQIQQGRYNEPVDHGEPPRNPDESVNNPDQSNSRLSRGARRRANRANRSRSRQAAREQGWMDASAREESVNTYRTRPGDFVRARMGEIIDQRVHPSRLSNIEGALDHQSTNNAQQGSRPDDTTQQRQPRRTRTQRRRDARRANSNNQQPEHEDATWDGVYGAENEWQEQNRPARGQPQGHLGRRVTFDYTGSRT